jgi:hypothetical protein
MPLEKVIFIGGTSYSGSTFFDMILSNDPAGFSCGEVDALFYPYRPNHINPFCGCGNSNCSVWSRVLKNGDKKLFHSIESLLPQIEFIVTSAKGPFWQKGQITILKKDKVCFKNILIWKDPYDFAYSYKRRGRSNWDVDWINYHRLYFSSIKQWKAVNYRALTTNPDTLAKVCEYLGIENFSEKPYYWNKTHHTLFGNSSAKIHMYNKNDATYRLFKDKLLKESKGSVKKIENDHQHIYYNCAIDEDLKTDVEERLLNNYYMKKIIRQLEKNDVSNALNNYDDIGDIRYSEFIYALKYVKYQVVTKYRGLKLAHLNRFYA